MKKSKKQLEKLIFLRDRFQQDLEKLEENAGKFQEEMAEEANYEDRISEIASLALGHELNLSLEEQVRLVLERVSAAIEAIESGTYGKCSACGRQIPEERLEIVPYADKCVACQSLTEGQ